MFQKKRLPPRGIYEPMTFTMANSAGFSIRYLIPENKAMMIGTIKRLTSTLVVPIRGPALLLMKPAEYYMRRQALHLMTFMEGSGSGKIFLLILYWLWMPPLVS